MIQIIQEPPTFRDIKPSMLETHALNRGQPLVAIMSLCRPAYHANSTLRKQLTDL